MSSQIATSIRSALGAVLLGHVLALAARGGDGANSSSAAGGGSSGSATFDLSGSIQKGPFILGTTVSISVLDAALAPTTETVLTQTTNDSGEFSATGLPVAPVQFEAT